MQLESVPRRPLSLGTPPIHLALTRLWRDELRVRWGKEVSRCEVLRKDFIFRIVKLEYQRGDERESRITYISSPCKQIKSAASINMEKLVSKSVKIKKCLSMKLWQQYTASHDDPTEATEIRVRWVEEGAISFPQVPSSSRACQCLLLASSSTLSLPHRPRPIFFSLGK